MQPVYIIPYSEPTFIHQIIILEFTTLTHAITVMPIIKVVPADVLLAHGINELRVVHSNPIMPALCDCCDNERHLYFLAKLLMIQGKNALCQNYWLLLKSFILR